MSPWTKLSFDAAVLRLVAGAREHREGQVEADDLVAAARELDGVPARAAREIEHGPAALDAEALLDEVDLARDLRVGDLLHRADVVVVEEVLPPEAALAARARRLDRLRHERCRRAAER